MDSPVLEPDITLATVLAQAERAANVVAQVRGAVLAPEARKQAPRFTTGQVMQAVGLTKPQMDYALRKGDLPPGELTGAVKRREFSLGEYQEWVRAYHPQEQRPQGARGLVVSIANFKGGVSKTTVALTLAQGLSLRGHRVLVIDTDPQGSITTLFGILPDTEVQDDDTVLPLVQGAQASIRYAIRPTYWSGIDLVAAAPLLFGAEFALADRMAAQPGFEYWRVLERGLADVLDDYDVVLLDTPPALTYTTLNVLMASDGIIMPLPPNALDFASSAQFWRLFGDIASGLPGAMDKRFSFINVLPAKVESTDAAGAEVRAWMGAAYGERLMPAEVPKSAATSTASANFGTVYDASVGSSRTVKRATDAFDRLVDAVLVQCVTAWRKQLAEGAR